MLLKEKVAIVTGGARGIGEGIGLAFAKEGASVVIADVLKPRAEKVSERIRSMGRKSLVFELDVRREEEALSMVSAVKEEFGKIDILVNNAGVWYVGPLVETLVEDWDRVMDINAKGVFICAKSVAKLMMKQRAGTIVNIASRVGKRGERYNGPYSASKAAVLRLTEVLALELAPYNIRVNAICPGVVDTEMEREAIKVFSRHHRLSPDDFQKQVLSQILVGRMATPEDIAGVAVFLASDDASYMTGVAIDVTGGTELS